MLVTGEKISALEEGLLRMICQGGLNRKLREEVLSRLRAYAFRSVRHQVLFDCLCELLRHKPELTRILLPARLVQAGFPDMDIAPFFEPHGLTPQDAGKILARLTGTMQSQETAAGV